MVIRRARFFGVFEGLITMFISRGRASVVGSSEGQGSGPVLNRERHYERRGENPCRGRLGNLWAVRDRAGDSLWFQGRGGLSECA